MVPKSHADLGAEVRRNTRAISQSTTLSFIVRPRSRLQFGDGASPPEFHSGCQGNGDDKAGCKCEERKRAERKEKFCGRDCEEHRPGEPSWG